jgi:hypothetical protein
MKIQPPLAPFLQPFQFGDNGTLYVSGTKLWNMSCMYVDGIHGVVRPNYDNPACVKGAQPQGDK